MICSYCNNEKARPIFYGEIGFSSLEELEEFEKKYFLADEDKGENSPDFHCDNCGEKFSAGTGFGVAERHKVKPGVRVAIVLKADQPTGKLTEGIVKDILTSKPNHPRGIKVRLTDGQVGRVQKIL